MDQMYTTLIAKEEPKRGEPASLAPPEDELKRTKPAAPPLQGEKPASLAPPEDELKRTKPAAPSPHGVKQTKPASPAPPHIQVRDVTPNLKRMTTLERAQDDFNTCVQHIQAKEWKKAEDTLPSNICHNLKMAINAGWQGEEKNEFDTKHPPVIIEVTFSDIKQSVTRQWAVNPYLTVGDLIESEIELTHSSWIPRKKWTVFYNDTEYIFNETTPLSNSIVQTGDKLLIHSPKRESDDRFQ